VTYAFIGLGNPGFRYATTRHNIGFMFVDFVRSAFDFPIFSYDKFLMADVSRKNVGDKEVVLAKPETYMNRSGESVKSIVNHFNVDISNIYIAHDDMDFKFGKLKIKTGGGAAGHNGIKSVQQELNEKKFNRIRLGIDRPVLEDNISIPDYVLQKFLEEQLLYIKDEWALTWKDLFVTLLDSGLQTAMNKFH